MTAPTSYEDLLADLFHRRRAGMVFELQRMERAIEALDLAPRVPVVRIGGTNGKGSTCAFLESLATSAGLRTGVFTSPHLHKFTERFRIGGQAVTESELVAAAQGIWSACAGLTFFECATLLALASFARAGVDLVILEVGLGGRLDATNAVPAVLAAVTGVDYDHCDILGDSLHQIAGEKAGIFRPGLPAVIGLAGAGELLAQHAQAMGASPICRVGDADLMRIPHALDLGGAHQRMNAACALCIADCLAGLGHLTMSEPVAEALRHTACPGRMEWLVDDSVIVDGAHNAQAARVLAAYIDTLEARPRTLVVGVSANKDATGMLAELLPLFDHIVVCNSMHPRAFPAARLAALVTELGRVCRVFDVVSEAVIAAQANGGLTVVTGSLFTAAEARGHLVGQAADVLQVTDP